MWVGLIAAFGRWTGGLRSACTYVGASCLKDLSKRTTFIRVTAQTNEVFASTHSLASLSPAVSPVRCWRRSACVCPVPYLLFLACSCCMHSLFLLHHSLLQSLTVSSTLRLCWHCFWFAAAPAPEATNAEERKAAHGHGAGAGSGSAGAAAGDDGTLCSCLTCVLFPLLLGFAC